jgi:hypothetical protein
MSTRNIKIIMFLGSKVRRVHCTDEAEWTPIQTHYFPGNLVAPGIEPGPLDL